VSSLLSPAYGQAVTVPKLTDEQIAAFAESLELAAVAAYQAAAAKITTPAVASAAGTFAGHHSQHATAFASLAKGAATGKPNPKLLQTIAGELHDAPDEKTTVKIAFDLENAAASTYLYALGVLSAAGALQLTASILPVESQHAVVLGQVLGLPMFEATAGSSDPYAGTGYVPTFVTQDQKIDPAVYPAATKG
jgi:rubrerythrin